MKVYEREGSVIVDNLEDFDLSQTMECGQAFHFCKIADNEYGIVAYNRLLHAKQTGKKLELFNTTLEDYENIWKIYFDIERDYGLIKRSLLETDAVLKEAVDMMWGIRILNQNFFETLISFIISQNKQIPHIKQIVSTISIKYGEYLGNIGGEAFYSFPTLEQMLGVSEEMLRECKTGFRAAYIRNAVEMAEAGVINEEMLRQYDSSGCIEQLMQIKGVGMKVASCVALFSLGKRDSFPVDVWIKRIVEALYFNGEERKKEEIERFGADKFGEYGGYAQQYLFYYGKTLKMGTEKKQKR